MTTRSSMDSTVARPLPQGDLGLLKTPLAQRLLNSAIPCRFAFTAKDGTPRVMPTWFHWNGEQIVTVTYLAGPNIGIRHAARRIENLRAHPTVAITIDTDTFPPEALLIRGDVTVTEVEGVADEYRLAAQKYLGIDGARELVASVGQPGTRQARIVLQPAWAGLLDFQTRLPSAQGGPSS